MASTLQRKVAKVLSSRSRFDSPDVLESCEGLSEIFTDAHSNTLENRRRLRSLLDRRSLHVHQSFTQSFTALNTEINDLTALIASLSSQCETQLNALKQVKNSNEQLLEKTAKLKSEQQSLEHRRDIVEKFLEKFTLKEEENQILLTGEINEKFFFALINIEKIKAHCQTLLHHYHQRVGLDVLDSLSKKCAVGYERLYKYVLESINSGMLSLTVSVDDSDDANVNSVIQSLAILSQQAIYFDHCANELCQQHRLLTINAFMRALTKGNDSSNNGKGRGLDVNAADSVKYVSDMLAWVHTQVANQEEYFDTLFTTMKNCYQQFHTSTSTHTDTGSDSHSTGNVSTAVTVFDDASRRRSMLGSVFEGLGRVLKVRIEQSLAVQPTPEIAFKLWQIITFYCSMLAAMFDDSAIFRGTLRALIDMAHTHFFNLLRVQGDRLIQSPPSMNADLSTPPLINEIIAQMNEILTIKQLSPMVETAQSTSAAIDNDLAPVLSALLDPVLTSINTSIKTQLNEVDALIYQINIILPIITALKRFDFEATHVRAEILALELDSTMERLVGELHLQVMKKCGLDEKLATLTQWKSKGNQSDSGKLIDQSGFDTVSLIRAVQSFESLLFSVGSFLVPQCDRILQSNLRRQCRTRIASMIAHSYRTLYVAVHDTVRSGYDRPTTIAKHTPEQIDTILEINAPTVASTPHTQRAVSSSVSLSTPFSVRR